MGNLFDVIFITFATIILFYAVYKFSKVGFEFKDAEK